MSVCFECCVLSEFFDSADHSSIGVLPCVEGVTECDRETSEERRSW